MTCHLKKICFRNTLLFDIHCCSNWKCWKECPQCSPHFKQRVPIPGKQFLQLNKLIIKRGKLYVSLAPILFAIFTVTMMLMLMRCTENGSFYSIFCYFFLIRILRILCDLLIRRCNFFNSAPRCSAVQRHNVVPQLLSLQKENGDWSKYILFCSFFFF